MLDFRGIVSVVSIVVYVPFLVVAAIAIHRGWFGMHSPWVYLAVMSLLRIVGDSLQLATESPSNADNVGLFTGAAICDAVGLGPLILCTTRLLSQCNDFIHTKEVPNQTHRALVTFELATLISTILAIVGGQMSFKADAIQNGSFHPSPIFEAGIVLYAVTYACVVAVAVVVACRADSYADTVSPIEGFRFKYTVSGILMALILLCLRIVYALLFSFDRARQFSPFAGSETIQLCMQTLEEWLVVGIYLSIAVAMRRAAPPEKEKAGKSERGGEVRRVLRYVPFVHWFVR